MLLCLSSIYLYLYLYIIIPVCVDNFLIFFFLKSSPSRYEDQNLCQEGDRMKKNVPYISCGEKDHRKCFINLR